MDWLRRAAASRPGAPAVITPDRTYTYAEIDRAADAVAAIITASDLGGVPVAFWGERDAATVAAVWGIPRVGVTAVAVDPGLPPAESMRLTREAGARGLWAMPEGGVEALLLRSLPPKGGVPRRGEGGDEELSGEWLAADLAAPPPSPAKTPATPPPLGEESGGVRVVGPQAEGESGQFLPPKGGVPRRGEGGDEEITARSSDLPSGVPRRGEGGDEELPRFILFTSGTTGPRKGVLLTEANIAAAVTGSQQRLGNGPDDAWLAVLPLHHIGGLSILWRQAAVGAAVVLHPTFDPVAAAAALERVAFASVVPTMLHRMLAAGARGHPGLRGVLVGGGPADTSILRTALDAGLPVLQTYGMTETCSQVCTVAPGDQESDLGTAGRPLDGAEVAIGDDGRIQVRGAMVSPGYLSAPLRGDEWFVTGDRGRIDDRGRLVVLGRADRVIVTGGENVQPETVEAALLTVPGVTAARVTGESDPEWGQRVVAEVVLVGITAAAVEAAVRPRLAPAELPREWRVVGEISAKLE